MPKVIPILFTTANPLTAAQINILSQAKAILTNDFGFDVQRPMISLVNDAYIKQRIYPKVELNGKTYHRSLFNAKERLELAKATIEDMQLLQKRANGEEEALPFQIDINAYELYHHKTPNSLPQRGYIESWEMLEYLQRAEIERSRSANIEPTLYILVAGIDTANLRGNWNELSPAIPFMLATRKTINNETGALKQQINLESPSVYLKRLGYEGNAFNHFKSGVFECIEDSYNNLSSTKLAECKLETLTLMGDKAFEELVKILAKREQSKSLKKTAPDQIETAKVSLMLIKKHALAGLLGEEKKAIIKRLFPGDLKSETLLQTIKSFCNSSSGGHIAGLDFIKNMLNQAAADKESSPNEVVTQLIIFAKWKKSDSNLARFFHHKIRHRAPETENFYQLLASLDTTDTNSWDHVILSIQALTEKNLDALSPKVQP
ncbi:hypothetical protein ACNVED_11825 [Legionella sp. D16C41]|uniref:hypothetical protein n=1 Tax=Legionella sp. D16C41 TaxID=3402688 RepID=UPI003AF78E38